MILYIEHFLKLVTQLFRSIRKTRTKRYEVDCCVVWPGKCAGIYAFM